MDSQVRRLDADSPSVPLRRILRRVLQERLRLPAPWLLWLGEGFGATLEAAHDPASVRHVTLSSLVVTCAGHPGFRLPAEAAPHTTPVRYRAPEALRGRPADERSNLYTLASVLAELALGRTLLQPCAAPRRNPDLPWKAWRTLRACLEADYRRRPSNASVFLGAWPSIPPQAQGLRMLLDAMSMAAPRRELLALGLQEARSARRSLLRRRPPPRTTDSDRDPLCAAWTRLNAS